MANVKEETARGIKWGLIQKLTMQPLQFLYGIILARLISPDEMGILGLTAIFFALAGQLQECGFGTALIRKQDRTHEDICTVFWFNVGMSFVLSFILFLSAPLFAAFFNQPALVNLTRVSALLMFLNSTTSVHMTLYQARRDFKTPALVSMCTTLVAMPFTIWAAFSGWSYWAPMLQGIITGVLTLITIWVISPWKPKCCFSTASFREFFRFGLNLAISGIITQFYLEARTFIIGKFYSPAQLAYFTRGQHTCSSPLQLATSILTPITLPVLATLQHDQERLAQVFRQFVRLMSMVIEWGMITLAANSAAIIVLLYGENWETAAEYARILCFGWMLNPLTLLNTNFFAVQGRSDLHMKIAVILRPISIIVMILCAFHSVAALCFSAIFAAGVSFSATCYLVTRISSIRIRDLAADFFPYLVMALVANIPSFFIDKLDWLPICRLALGLSTSILIYGCILLVKRDRAAAYLLAYAKEKIARKRS